MTFDFTKLTVPSVGAAPTDPYKIFTGLPRLEGTPNDLWRGQSEALNEWNTNYRDKRDILISLNTGAGKTLVGLLIAKSFCNEGLDNVLYVCPTNDLVMQTAAQARSWGIEVTTRMKGGFDNDLFETGKTFCITTYHAIFNGLSSLRRRHFPDAIIFDDAHVAESMMRDSFTLSLSQSSQPQLFKQIADLYLPTFRELARQGEYGDALDLNRPLPSSVMVPPDAVAANVTQLGQLLAAAGIADDENLKYVYPNIRDHLDVCAVVFRGGVVEISPPFLPSLAVDIFDRRVRRVYLSATLHNKADIVRAFGRLPDIIEPNNDAGNGERLIVFERELNTGQRFDAAFARSVTADHKVLISIPGYYRADAWKTVATPPDRDKFSVELDLFRKARSGAFVLVSRVDGIDLPHETCRLMMVDGLPKSEGLLERYQFDFLHMRTFAASRLANRLVQLFGRINRGRSDYGAFLIAGHELNVWLANDKHVALLPDLLKNQILLGRFVQSEMKVRTQDEVKQLLSKVLLAKPRDAGWLAFYQQYLDANRVNQEKSDRAKLIEERNIEAAKAEAVYAKSVWERDFRTAREALDAIVANTSRADEKLAGWHNLWIGAACFRENDPDQGRFYYAQARGQLGLNLNVATGPIAGTIAEVQPRNAAVERQAVLLSLSRESFEKQHRSITQNLAPLDGGTAPQVEEAVRYLGELLGFVSSRPDNDVGTGPDVMWKNRENSQAVGIECKTDKLPGGAYTKEEIGQSFDHISWMNENSETAKVLGIVLVGPAEGCTGSANPSDDLYQAPLSLFAGLRDTLLAAIRDAYQQVASNRLKILEHQIGQITFDAVAAQLMETPLKR